MAVPTVCVRRCVSDDLVALAQAVASWAVPPSCWSGGRAGWLVLPERYATQDAQAWKLKGLGRRPHLGDAAQLPSADVYDRWPGQRPDPHFGIGSDLEFTLLNGDPAPTGGLSLEAAVREQDCATSLLRAGVAAVQPVAAFEFAGRSFNYRGVARPTGVSVTASPLAEDRRLSELLSGAASEEELNRVCEALAVRQAPNPSQRALEAVSHAYRAFGRSLRDFFAAGWFRYSGHPGNVAIDELGRALLVDLDSCRPTSNVSVSCAALESVRDGMSALYNLACSFFHEPALSLFSDVELLAHEPFSGFILGWDPEGNSASAKEDGRRLAAYVNESRGDLREFSQLLNQSPLPDRVYRRIRHDRDLTFSWLFRMMYRRRLERPHHMEMPFTLREMDERLLRFAGLDRVQRLQELES